jgi:hypothetical protein
VRVLLGWHGSMPMDCDLLALMRVADADARRFRRPR